MLFCVQDISWTSGWIVLIKLWDIRFCDLGLIFNVTGKGNRSYCSICGGGGGGSVFSENNTS